MNQFYYFQVFNNILLIVLDIWKKKGSNLNEYSESNQTVHECVGSEKNVKNESNQTD